MFGCSWIAYRPSERRDCRIAPVGGTNDHTGGVRIHQRLVFGKRPSMDEHTFLQPRPSRVLKIGAYEGRSTVWMVENLLAAAGGSLTAVDTWEAGPRGDQKDMGNVEARFDGNRDNRQTAPSERTSREAQGTVSCDFTNAAVAGCSIRFCERRRRSPWARRAY